MLAELGLPGPLVEQPNDTARLLAAVLRCCWEDPAGPVWPGVAGDLGAVLDGVPRGIADRATRRRTAAPRWPRCAAWHQAAWVRWDEAAHRAARRRGWRRGAAADLTTLRELCRSIQLTNRPAG